MEERAVVSFGDRRCIGLYVICLFLDLIASYYILFPFPQSAVVSGSVSSASVFAATEL